MSTVTATPTISKSFYAVLYQDNGQLAKVNGDLVFFSDAGAITTVEPDMINFLAVLGQVSTAETQAMCDRISGGPAWIATHRAMEVA